MRIPTTKTFQNVTDEKLATLIRSRWNWNRIRIIGNSYWLARLRGEGGFEGNVGKRATDG